jgi:hypothetical protein
MGGRAERSDGRHGRVAPCAAGRSGRAGILAQARRLACPGAPHESTLGSLTSTLAKGAGERSEGDGTLGSWTSTLAKGAGERSEGGGTLGSWTSTLAKGAGERSEGTSKGAKRSRQRAKGAATLRKGARALRSFASALSKGRCIVRSFVRERSSFPGLRGPFRGQRNALAEESTSRPHARPTWVRAFAAKPAFDAHSRAPLARDRLIGLAS